jgi:hypothetical protein
MIMEEVYEEAHARCKMSSLKRHLEGEIQEIRAHPDKGRLF